MHEMGIALQIIDIATESIPAELKGRKVARINLRIGKLAAIVADSLHFCFGIASRETAVEGAELNIREIPVKAHCRECNTHWTLSGPAFTCEKCNSGNIEVTSGRELDIESIEIADPDPPSP